MTVFLTADQMRALEAHVFAGGRLSSLEAMEAAGRAVAAAVLQRRADTGKAIVLAGPGNNGGDGYVVARHLAQAGWAVTVAAWGVPKDRAGDAQAMRDRWSGPVTSVSPGCADGFDVIIDALFGIGQTRGLRDDLVASLPACLWGRAAGRPLVVAVDLPSGLHSDTGQIFGAHAIAADLTVTFGEHKRCHALYPGRSLCGVIERAQVGLGLDAGSGFSATDLLVLNARPEPWFLPQAFAHKHARGHAFIRSGGLTSTGAARLAAQAAARLTGLVTVLSPPDALMVHAGHLTGIMLARCDGARDVAAHLADPRNAAILIGPANGMDDETSSAMAAALASDKPVVLDADALTCAAGAPDALFDAVQGRGVPTVLTPHMGEFRRLFPDLDAAADKPGAVRRAASRSGAVILLKGPDTIVAAPDGRTFVNLNAASWLATAGSGDVLAGLVAGLLAGGGDGLTATLTAAWLHGEAGIRCGPGLVAEDLTGALPAILRDLAAG